MDEQNNQLLVDVSKQLELNNQLIQKLQNVISDMKPKAEFYDLVTDSKDMIEMSEVAKVIGIQNLGRNKLFDLLRKTKILRSNNEPYQAYVDRGYFKLIEQKVELPYGEIMINRKTVVSQKGIEFINKIIGNYYNGID